MFKSDGKIQMEAKFNTPSPSKKTYLIYIVKIRVNLSGVNFCER